MKVAAAYTPTVIGDIQQNIASTGKILQKLDRQLIDYVVFPEMNISGYIKTDENLRDFYKQKHSVIQQLKSISKEVDCAFSVGYPCLKSDSNNYIEQTIFYKGEIVGTHSKTHLSCNEKISYKEGNEINIFSINNTKVAIQLCYESHFPEISFIQSIKGADIISFSFASPRELAEEKIERFKRFLCARAYDNSVYVIACNLNGANEKGTKMNGLGLIINPKGIVISETTQPDEGYCIADIDFELLQAIRNKKMAYFNKFKRVDLLGNFYQEMTNME